MNGNPRSIFIQDKSSEQAKKVTKKERAVEGNKGSVGAPMPGQVLSVRVLQGQDVKKGEALIVMSAMKMETVVLAPISGKIVRVVVKPGDELHGNDLLVEILDAASVPRKSAN